MFKGLFWKGVVPSEMGVYPLKIVLRINGLFSRNNQSSKGNEGSGTDKFISIGE